MTLQLWFELQTLEAEYWYDVDMHWGASAASFYVEDGTFAIGEQRFNGRAEIAGFYTWRKSLGERTARHTFTNARAANVDDMHARFECIMLLYADNGLPVLESKPPVMIADVINDYVLTNGVWKLESRVLRPVFEGGVGATVPTATLPK